ncbi:MAG: glucose-1-phosphate adenylyltransferase, partial [Thiomonas sp.]
MTPSQRQSQFLTDDRQTQPHMLVRRSIALVLAGGRGSRLKQLTDKR